jgi:hypothetical protein
VLSNAQGALDKDGTAEQVAERKDAPLAKDGVDQGDDGL